MMKKLLLVTLFPIALVAVPTAEREGAQTVTVSMNTCFNMCGIQASLLYYEFLDEEPRDIIFSTAYRRAARYWRDCVADCDEEEPPGEFDPSGSSESDSSGS